MESMMTKTTRRYFYYGGVNLGQWLVVNKIKRSATAPMSNEFKSVPDRHGLVHASSSRGATRTTVLCSIHDKTLKELDMLRAQIASVLLSPEPKLLRLYDSTFSELAIVDGEISWEVKNGQAQLEVSFINPEGVRLGMHQQVSLTEGGTRQILVAGTLPTPALITGIGDGAYKVTINGVAVSGRATARKAITIDYAQHYVHDAMSFLDLSSRFTELQPGMNKITCTGIKSPRLEWTERWH